MIKHDSFSPIGNVFYACFHSDTHYVVMTFEIVSESDCHIKND